MRNFAGFRGSFVPCVVLLLLLSSLPVMAREAKKSFTKASVGRAPIGTRRNASAPAGEPAAALLAGLNGAILELYDDLALIEISENDKATLKGRGDEQSIPVTVRDEFDKIFLNGITIDARDKDAIPPGHAPDPPYQGNEQGAWVVQFIGPIKPEWLDHFANVGIVPAQYVSMHAYIVGAPESAIRAIEHLPYVQWTSQLHRFLKPSVGPKYAPVTLWIELVQTEETPTAVEALQALSQTPLVSDVWSATELRVEGVFQPSDIDLILLCHFTFGRRGRLLLDV